MIRNLVKLIRQKFLELNLYKKHSSNEHTLEKELLATRIYLIGFIVCLSIITITVALIVRPVDKIEYKPSHEKFSQLIRKYPNTLRCPCSKPSTTYDKFVTSEVNFHQVCSSEFIQQAWIEKIFTQKNISIESIDDVRTTLSFFWQTIAGLCMASNKSWNTVLENFESTSLITPMAIAEQVIRTQAEHALRYQIDLSKTTSVRNLLALQRIIRGDQIVSALQTNFYLRYQPADLDRSKPPKMAARMFGNCTCLNIEGCPRSATFNDSYGHLINIPGMIVDCLIVDGTLNSTLECYYNQSCISMLHGQSSMYIQPLSNNSNKNFSMYSTVQSIFNKSMIDETITEIRFDKYFLECNCPFCSYSYTRRFDMFFIFTAVTGSIGILSFIIRHIASFVATKILRRKNRILPMENVSTITSMEQNQKQRIQLRIRLLLIKLWQAIISLNLFEKETHRTPINIYREQLLTRFFIFFIVSLSIAAGVYTYAVQQNQEITILNPSLDTYEQLYKDHPTTLYCPCSEISILNQVFLNVTFELHQVCSSDLVSLEWLYYLISFDPTDLPPPKFRFPLTEDFREMGASYFQLLAAFCSLAEMNIADAQHVFINTEFINDRVPSESRFTQQTEAMMTSFIRTTNYDFVQTFNWMKLIFLFSRLYNGLNTNVDITINNNNQVTANFRGYTLVNSISGTTIAGQYSCTCGLRPEFCHIIPTFYENTTYLDFTDAFINTYLLYKVLYLGCSPLSGFLMSRTKWWYDITYMKRIQETYSMIIYSRPSPDIKPLNQSISTRFDNPETRELLGEMLFENATKNASFDRFYNACKPSSCSYTVVQRRSYIVVLFLLISICSGLNKGLQLLVPLIGASPISVRFRNSPSIIYRKIKNFNIYETESNDNNTHIRQQQIYTRVYLFLYIILLSIVLFYTVLIERRISKTQDLHSIGDHEKLLSLYSNDISCPCTYTSIAYDEFITELKVNSSHEACGYYRLRRITAMSVIEHGGSGTSIYDKEYSRSVLSFVESLEQLCSLAEDNVNNNIDAFLASTLFTNQLMSRSLFNTEMDEILTQFKNKTKTTFAHMLDLIRSTIQGNALLHVSSQAWSLVKVKTNNGSNINFLTVSLTLNNTQENISCLCSILQTCRIPRQVNIEDRGLITIDGMVIGCHQLETLLLSSLACFYSLQCINDLRANLGELIPIMKQFEGLNASTTRFSVNDTIEKIAYEMFIESWSNNTSYETYFNSCSPSYCIYTYYQKSNALEILTTFLSAYGSLSIAVYFIVPYLVKLIKKILICFRITQQQ
ncbi:unnamed protein product [Adineta steineri]|uniref:Uncharacterized protein n=1 Tax=Adineta steineri TaxID=433720 RepID=A0A815K7K3_9BILA|nr:unnamed protein product [Adineta steineri]CAF1611490.1 unnamed protein product [Adineta steineri]